MTKLEWSCDEKDRANCRNAHGCHCREITELLRLRDALFKIQCEQLDRATDVARSAKSHREKCMATRDRIITILSTVQ